MSSRSEGDCGPVFGSPESCDSGDSITAEAEDIEGCIEKLSKFGAVRVPIFEEGEAREWFRRIQSVSKVTWRVLRTSPGERTNVFKVEYRCQHNVRGTQALKTKNINCPAKLLLILKRTQLAKGAKSRSKDPLNSSHPLIASLKGEHNHSVEWAAALKYRDVSEEVQQVLKDLFASGHSPSSAYNLLRCQLMAKEPERYFFNAADRHHLPDLKYCYNFYYKVCREEYSVPAGDVLLTAAKARAAASNGTMACRSTADNADEGLQASEAEPASFANAEQLAEEGAAEENTDELRETVRQLHDFIELQAATPGRGKHLMAMLKVVKRLGNGRALERALLAFGQMAAPSLRATKSSSTIVQPTAVARRKMALGRRKKVFAGRRVCQSQFFGQPLQAAKRKKVPAPHSLSHSLEHNVSVPKAH